MSTNVFLSVGYSLTPGQDRFVNAVGALLKAHGLVPRTVGRTDFADRQPLKRVAEVMRECSGTIVVALSRIHIHDGREVCGPQVTGRITNVHLPTVWNQIEAAMAYSLGQPLLAIVETGLRNEGVLEQGYDWCVKWVDLAPPSLADPGFLKIFDAWKKDIVQYEADQLRRLSADRFYTIAWVSQ